MCDQGGLLFIICKLGELLSAVIPVIVALGVVYFVYGVVTYVIASDEEAKKSCKNRVIYGLIGFAVIIGLWGLVYIVTDTFFIADDDDVAPSDQWLKGLLPSSRR